MRVVKHLAIGVAFTDVEARAAATSPLTYEIPGAGVTGTAHVTCDNRMIIAAGALGVAAVLLDGESAEYFRAKEATLRRN